MAPEQRREDSRPTGDWDAVADAIRARMAELAVTQLELASKADVSLATVQELSSGMARRRYGRTLAAVSTALGWPSDQIERISAGEAAPDSTQQGVADEVRELREELARINRRLDELEADQ